MVSRLRSDNAMILAVLVLSSAVCGLAQQAETTVGARHVIGLEHVKRNSPGKLTIQNAAMQFQAGATDAKVPIASIDDLSVGSETTQAGGKAGTVAKTAAIAAPYDTGAALSVVMRTKVDILTVSNRDSSGGLHFAILAVPKGQGEQQRAQLIAAGAHASEPAGGELKERKAAAPAAQKVDSQKLSASAIQIDPVEAGDVQIPA